MENTLARKLVTEFMGMALFALTVVTAIYENPQHAVFAIGAILMVMVYAGGHISGGHYNPAVSLAVFVRGRIPLKDLVGYWIVQMAGAALGAGIARYLVNVQTSAPAAFKGRHIGTAFVAELIFTFALGYVVLNVATSKDQRNNGFYGLAIGFVVLAGALAVGAISNGAFNPAIGLAISIGCLSAWGNFWIYVVACLVGGALAGVVFRFLNPNDK